MTEVYKRLNGLSLNIMNDVLKVQKHWYDTRHHNLFVTDRPKTDGYGKNSIPNRANQSDMEVTTQHRSPSTK